MIGKLFVVATPIGNMKDITLRAIDILKDVDVIFAEKPRHSLKLLSHYGISKPLYLYNDRNWQKQTKFALNLINKGENIALISDAGTPAIQDPGYRMVKYLRENNIDVIPIPGPCASICALQASGLPTDRFVFLGFLPRSSGKKKKLLKMYGSLDATLIIYESPLRVKKTLNDIEETLGEREMAVVRELTKVYEEFLLGTSSQLIPKTENIKGECIILVRKSD
jgi:16S rRNA (cytidine1402-2'-O)-methyltransferase